ncbi:hypothetical protein K8I28_16820 [bacterium]|nr:hypothetical protein [bacterium]
MERKEVAPTIDATVNSPSDFRLRWRDTDLVLEKLNAQGKFVVIARPELDIPPIPYIATHPELRLLLREFLRVVREHHLDDNSTLDLILSPPFGNAWVLPIGFLEDDSLQDQLEWELQQKIERDLSEMIYLWQPLDEKNVYTVLIAPELLRFWFTIAEESEIPLGTIGLESGLISEELEKEVDFHSLYLLWQRRGESISVDESDEPLPVEETPAALETYDDTDEDEDKPAISKIADEAFDDSDSFDYGQKSNRKKVLIPLLIVFGLIVISGGGYYFRDNLGSLLGGSDNPEATPIADNNEIIDSTTVPIQTPAAKSSLAVISSVFKVSDDIGVRLSAFILQGSEFRILPGGDTANFSIFRTNLAATPGIQKIVAQSPSFEPVAPIITGVISYPQEEEMTASQFNNLLAELGISTLAPGVIQVNKNQLTQLVERLQFSGLRPYRISIQQNTPTDYLLSAMP